MSNSRPSRFPFVLHSTFDDYNITGQLGAGGSGIVYEGTTNSGSTCAIKVLKQGAATIKKKRFQNEISFCMKSTHRNIVRIIDHGLTGDDPPAPFYVMPRYRATLRDVMREGLPQSQILPLFTSILNGVEAAHLKGVYHRDLKPENILIVESDGRPLIADFGIAHFEEEDLLTAVETRDQERLANFVYAAPEQRTRGNAVDGRADIYALGLILNEMYTGTVPHGTGFRRISEVAPEFEYLDQIVDSMLRQNPADRSKTIDAIKRELIARGNEFVARQRLSKTKDEVVAETEMDDPLIENPITISAVDYVNGALVFTLSATPPPNWIMEFKQPRTSFSFFPGKEPVAFSFNGNKASVGLDHYDAQRLIDYTKSYVAMANKQYAEGVIRDHQRRLENERESLRKQAAEDARRAEILSKIKL